MNADLEELLEGDAETRRLVETLRRAPQARVAAGFSARVMAEVRAQRRRAWLSAPSQSRYAFAAFLPASRPKAMAMATLSKLALARWYFVWCARMP